MIIFITGASSGLGAALARHYAATLGTEAVIGLAGRDVTRLEAVALSLAPARGAIYPFDIRDRNALKTAAHDFVSRFGAPDLVIANAGISAGTRGDDGNDLDILADILAANVTGLAATLQAFIPSMRARGGVLAGIASVAGIRGIPGSGAYSASKAGIMGLTRDLAQQWGGRKGIRVNALAPGFFVSEMTDELKPGYLDSLMPRIILGRLGDATELAATAVWLASPAAGYVTGQTIVVDGGLTIA